MTTGFFTADREPALPLEIRGPDGAQSFDAVIDTGYNGALTLPPDWINALGLPQWGRASIKCGECLVHSIDLGLTQLKVEIRKCSSQATNATLHEQSGID